MNHLHFNFLHTNLHTKLFAYKSFCMQSYFLAVNHHSLVYQYFQTFRPKYEENYM